LPEAQSVKSSPKKGRRGLETQPFSWLSLLPLAFFAANVLVYLGCRLRGFFDMTAPVLIWSLSGTAFVIGLILLIARTRPLSLVLAGIVLAFWSGITAE
jgi:hypothetical protein